MSGKLGVSVRIGPNGEVQSASMVSNSGLSPAATDCVVRVLKQAQFDAIGGGGSTMQVPLVFTRAK